jgi:hypothetical protein
MYIGTRSTDHLVEPLAGCPSHPGDLASDPSSRLTCEVDPDFLEYARHEQLRVA